VFQQILNFVLANAWILIIVLGGLFNVTVRVAQKAKEQRAKRDALQEMARQKQEALRTGRPVATPRSAAPQQAQQSPKDRIEALRQERMAQLRALREKRAGSPTPPAGPPTASPTATAAPTTVGQSHPTLPPIPVQPRPRPQAQPQHRSQPRPAQPMAPQQRRRRVIAPSAQPEAQRPKAPKPTERTAAKLESIRGASKSTRPGLSKSTGFVPEIDSAREMLRSRSSIRQAMILREILDTPIALRNQDIASGSLYS
jgi:hypothetical protein